MSDDEYEAHECERLKLWAPFMGTAFFEIEAAAWRHTGHPSDAPTKWAATNHEYTTPVWFCPMCGVELPQ